MSVLSANGLSVAVPGRRLCTGLDLDFGQGRCWAILGANGAGKTTLLLTLAGLHAPGAGEVRLDGALIARLPRRQIARRLGLLPQDSSDPFPATVLETALLGRHPHLGPLQAEGPADHASARAALEQVDLGSMAGRDVATLSGGERRRLAIATLLTQAPAVFLLDEPTNHLDLHHQVAILGHLRRLAAAGATVVMVLHDPTLAARFCDHALLLFGDGDWSAGRVEPLLDGTLLTRLYGHPITAVDTPAGRGFLPG